VLLRLVVGYFLPEDSNKSTDFFLRDMSHFTDPEDETSGSFYRTTRSYNAEHLIPRMKIDLKKIQFWNAVSFLVGKIANFPFD
jgi:hypothetical protein